MRFRFLIATLAFCLGLSAQTSLKDGYVILNTGDTVRGQIEEGTWNLNPASIVFRNAGSTKDYRVADLKGFGIGNEIRYERFHFTYEQTATELEHADETFEGPSETTDVWLRILY